VVRIVAQQPAGPDLVAADPAMFAHQELPAVAHHPLQASAAAARHPRGQRRGGELGAKQLPARQGPPEGDQVRHGHVGTTVGSPDRAGRNRCCADIPPGAPRGPASPPRPRPRRARPHHPEEAGPVHARRSEHARGHPTRGRLRGRDRVTTSRTMVGAVARLPGRQVDEALIINDRLRATCASDRNNSVVSIKGPSFVWPPPGERDPPGARRSTPQNPLAVPTRLCAFD
jgi:hypothetical protein